MGSFGVSLVAWFVAPAVLYALALGVGLALERITTFRVPNVLLGPLGLLMSWLALRPFAAAVRHAEGS